MKKYIIAAIFIFGILLRGVEVANGNIIFNFDAGRDLGVARNILVNHKLTLIGAEIGSGSAGINGIFQGPGYYYLLAVALFVSGGNPYGALAMMFLMSVAVLAAVFLTVRKIFDEPTAIIALFLTAVSPLIVSQARFLWAPHPGTILIVLYFYFVFMIAKKPRLYAPLAFAAAALTYHFEIAMTVPLVLTLLLALPLLYRVRDWRTYVYSCAVLVVVFSPMILFEMRHGFMAVRSVLSYERGSGPVGRDVWLLRIKDHSVPYLENAVNSFPLEHGFIPRQLYYFLIGGLLILLVKIKKTFFRFMLLSLIVSYVTFLFLNNIIWDYYLIHAHFIYIYLFAYAAWQSWAHRKKLLWAKAGLVALGIFFVSMCVSAGWRVYADYTYDIRDFGGVEKIKGKEAAIDYVYADAKGKPFNEFTFMAPIYTYPYEYLFATYGKDKYGYVPGTEKKGTVYLIVEPDQSKPWTYKGWMETVIGGGDIIWTRTLPTGHIIQKRIFP